MMSIARVSPTRPQRWTTTKHQQVIAFPDNSISADQPWTSLAAVAESQNDKRRFVHRRKILTHNQQFYQLTLIQRPRHSYCPYQLIVPTVAENTASNLLSTVVQTHFDTDNYANNSETGDIYAALIHCHCGLYNMKNTAFKNSLPIHTRRQARQHTTTLR